MLVAPAGSEIAANGMYSTCVDFLLSTKVEILLIFCLDCSQQALGAKKSPRAAGVGTVE